MELKFVNNPNFPCDECYTESGQTNNLRWQLHSFSEKLDGYYPLVAVMKCKDYFNDVAYLYTDTKTNWKDKSCSVYGFNANKLPYEEMRRYKGLFVKLTNVCEDFRENIQNKLNPWLVENNGEPLTFTDIDKTTVFLFIPESYLKTTLYISVLTQMIRYCNAKLKDARNDVFYEHTTDTHCNDIARVHLNQMRNFLKFGGFKFNEDFEKYIAFISYSKQLLESFIKSPNISTIHNCGFMTVMNNYAIAVKQKEFEYAM